MSARMRSGCMVCGAPLVYADAAESAACVYCGKAADTTVLCESRHFVCDGCHAADGLGAIRSICGRTEETDMVALMRAIRAHPAISVHGPEHHAMVPAIMVATYRNLGGDVGAKQLSLAIERGAKVPGGFCGFAGACGAAVGVGIGFGAILGASPVRPEKRRLVLRAVAEALASIAEREAARCCQRECWLALRRAAELSRELLPIALVADAPLVCEQHGRNKECIDRECPLFPDPDR